jgi:serine/threonine-protein kinase
VTESQPRARIGKYTVVDVLGEGAMGTVYRAHDAGLDRHVAVKVIRKDILGGRQAAQMVARFKNEAMAAGRLQHPGIVAVYDYGEDDASSYIVMEYAPGEELDVYATRRAPLGLSDIGSLVLQLLDALAYAHAAGVVHRDIKPSNLLVSSGGRLKITDFGIARLATSTLTQTGTALGTPTYMAPEQYTGVGVDHRADLFSVGVVLYELATGQRPFIGQSLHEVAYKICHVAPVRPTQLAPSLPPAVDGVVLNALAKDKAARFASAHDFAVAVAEVFGGAGPLAAAVVRSAVFTSWAPEVVKKLEAALAPFAGPIAPALVRRSVAKTQDRNELMELLRRGAGPGADGAALDRALRAVLEPTQPVPLPLPAPPATAVTPSPASAGLAPADLDRAAAALAAHVGPIAKVLVKRAAAQAKDLADLCKRLGEHLASDAERAELRRKLGV